MIRHIFAVALLVGFSAAGAFAQTPIIVQDFEAEAFKPGLTSAVGDQKSPGGRWFTFSDPAPSVTTEQAHSGSKSVLLQRTASSGGASLPGLDARRTLADEVGPHYEATFWVRRSPIGAMTFVVTDEAAKSRSIALAITPTGDLRYWDDYRKPEAGYVQADTKVLPEQWTRVRLVINLLAKKYDAYLRTEDGEEVRVTPPVGIRLAEPPRSLAMMRFVAQPPQEPSNMTYVDDVSLTSGSTPEEAAISDKTTE